MGITFCSSDPCWCVTTLPSFITYPDNSFNNSISFTKNNVLGTHVLIECCRKNNVQKYIHVSTDEVYGESAYDNVTPSFFSISQSRLELWNMYPFYAQPIPTQRQRQQPSILSSRTIKAITSLVSSQGISQPLFLLLSRSNNIYGPHQFPEKVVPKWICLLEKQWKMYSVLMLSVNNLDLYTATAAISEPIFTLRM